ncbi:hypothetical protein Tco_0469207 [Tanacetum coccineum]
MALSPLSFRKRYQGTYELIADTKSEDSKEESIGFKSEEATSKDRQQAVSVKGTTADKPLGLGYGAAIHYQQVADPIPRLPVRPTWVDPEDGTVYLDIEFNPSSLASIQNPASPEWSSSYLPVSPASLTVPSPVASLVTTPAATIAVDDDEFIKVGAQLELYGSILQDQTQHLDTLPPTLLEGMGQDITKLYDRSVAVKGEIHSQHFRLGSQEQGTITFGTLWLSVLALEPGQERQTPR